MSYSSATSSSFYDRSTVLSLSVLAHCLRTSAACAIYLLICSSMPRLPMKLSVFNFALPFLNSRSSESLEECSLDRESWVRLYPIVLILSPMWLALLFGLRVSRSPRFWFFYSIINTTLNITQTSSNPPTPLFTVKTSTLSFSSHQKKGARMLVVAWVC